MRKNLIFMTILCFLLLLVGCKTPTDVKVYEGTEEVTVTHVEVERTAVVTGIDLETNEIRFKDCMDSEDFRLIYHGGVSVLNNYGRDIGISGIGNGSVVDVLYYEDTEKIVSITINDKTTVLKGVTKFSADPDNGTAKYKGTSCGLWDEVVAYDGDKRLDITEINTEDQVTLNIFAGKVVSVVVELGHGYVRLSNQDTYVGGMVEIGYDVIVPVTSDMLVAVREGKYTLRIYNGNYSDSKPVEVKKGKEVTVDLADIAVPTGTVTFNITPAEATLYVSGEEQGDFVYTNLYGTYGIRVTCEGYNAFNGSFKISQPVNTFDIELKPNEDLTEETTEETTETTQTTTESTETTATESTGGSGDGTGGSGNGADGSGGSGDSGDTTEVNTAVSGTEGSNTTANTITVLGPVGAGVYVDGDYVGLAPVKFPKVVGTHTITLYKTGYLIKSYTITAADDGEDDEHTFPELTSVFDALEE
ncbi:MAG: PEGA domain-containing protein [Lachnospiraceae bacterium]|nr:PEGA domain-containing protein [Lachnospiraceae bacterium]